MLKYLYLSWRAEADGPDALACVNPGRVPRASPRRAPRNNRRSVTVDQGAAGVVPEREPAVARRRCRPSAPSRRAAWPRRLHCGPWGTGRRQLCSARQLLSSGFWARVGRSVRSGASWERAVAGTMRRWQTARSVKRGGRRLTDHPWLQASALFRRAMCAISSSRSAMPIKYQQISS